MSARLLRYDTVPPGGFRYFVPETKTRVVAPDWKSLVSKVISNLSANGHVPSALIESEIQEQLCASLPPGQCMNEAGKPVESRAQSLTWTEVKRGTLTLIAWAKAGRQKVDQLTAEARAKTCSECPYNQAIDGCSSCNAGVLREMVNMIVNGGTTKAENLLHACAFCGCSNKAQIWIPLEILHKHTPDDLLEALPDWCWKRK